MNGRTRILGFFFAGAFALTAAFRLATAFFLARFPVTRTPATPPARATADGVDEAAGFDEPACAGAAACSEDWSGVGASPCCTCC